MSRDATPKDADPDFDQDVERELAQIAFLEHCKILKKTGEDLGTEPNSPGELHLIGERMDMLGWNSLATDLGAFSDPNRGQWPYSMSMTVRDDLLAHGRQDSASTLGYAGTILEKVVGMDARFRRLERISSATLVVGVGILVPQIFR